MYIMMGTRTDLSYSLGYWSQFLEDHSEQHWKGVKRIFRYLKGSQSASLIYKATERSSLIGYSDADFANAKDGRSVSGFLFMYGKSPISWSSKKQTTVAQSTAESETIAASYASREMMWLKKLLKDLMASSAEPAILKVDNQVAIALAKNEGNHSRTKHIKVKYLLIQELIEEKHFELEFCETGRMIADIMTKPIERKKHSELMTMMSMIDFES